MGGERWGEDSGGVPQSLPHSEYFFCDSLEIVMKGKQEERNSCLHRIHVGERGFAVLTWFLKEYFV